MLCFLPHTLYHPLPRKGIAVCSVEGCNGVDVGPVGYKLQETGERDSNSLVSEQP